MQQQSRTDFVPSCTLPDKGESPAIQSRQQKNAESVISSFTNANEFDVTIDSVADILINSSLAMYRRFEFEGTRRLMSSRQASGWTTSSPSSCLLTCPSAQACQSPAGEVSSR
jgi:hypothetical protein